MSRTPTVKAREVKRWQITYGETYPYKWCIYLQRVPHKRFIHLSDALDYLEHIIRKDTC